MPERQPHSERTDCPIAHALEVFGDRWTLIIIRGMMFSNKHEFGEFLDVRERISSNTLTDRLNRMIKSGIVGVIPHPENKLKKLYYLTERGINLVPVVTEIALWSKENAMTSPRPTIPIKSREDLPRVQKVVTKMIRDWNDEHVGVGQ